MSIVIYCKAAECDIKTSVGLCWYISQSKEYFRDGRILLFYRIWLPVA